jgi:hexosaminidase
MKRNVIPYFLAFAAMIMFLLSCTKEIPSDLSSVSVIPRPVAVTSGGEWFTIKSKTGINVKGSEELLKTGQYLASKLEPLTDFSAAVTAFEGEPRQGKINLILGDTDPKLGEEGYELTISKKMVTVVAKTPAGIFNGVQTIIQLLPAVNDEPGGNPEPVKIATGTITDYPAYSYRGAMLDVARHFFSAEDVKQFIEYLALYKINVLHLHLSDDQGGRIEIKSWPELTAHGGSTEVGGGAGGFYTQEQYSDIVKFAQERNITIVPEIDMPGHTNAALASYPELNCNGKATELYTGTNVGFSTLCTDKEITYKFIDDVVREISALTPGPWFHIGGDESHATKITDYIPFVNRVQEIVTSHGKKVIGWDEIALSSLRPDAVAQHWANVSNAKKAVEQGARVLMSPAVKAYMDMQYDSTTPLGLHWASYIEVDAAYNWDPATLIPDLGKENIIGIEAPLWSETVTNLDEIEYMVFPRLPGYAEIGWTPAELRNWEEYKLRLGDHGQRFEALGINYYKSPLVTWE